jgi:hypothetical protein
VADFERWSCDEKVRHSLWLFKPPRLWPGKEASGFFRPSRKPVGSCEFQHLRRPASVVTSMHGRRPVAWIESLTGEHRTRQAIL